MLYVYSSATHAYTPLGTLLTGAGNSPYINGFDHDARRNLLHVSWTYRRFVEYAGVHDPASNAHKAQAGPNGPENNYDLCYAWSADGGRVWRGGGGKGGDRMVALADLGGGETVMPTCEGIRAFEIPMGSGILNQEGQCVALDGGFYVLNRERWEGVERWMVYWREAEGKLFFCFPHLAPLH